MSDSIRQQLEWACGVLYSISCSARLDSEILLAHCLHKERSYLLTWPERELSPAQRECFRDLVRRRLQPQPVAYLVGRREFYSLQLAITPATLVPRPETELLVDTVLELIQGPTSDAGGAPEILEMGTGSGAIALALKKHAPGTRIMATDISAAALQVAQSNAQTHSLVIDFALSDWYLDIPPQQFDVLVSNPPYIAHSDPYLGQGDLPAEPRQALCSGENGLEALQLIISGAQAYLKKGGWIVLEHGYDQQSAVTTLLFESDFKEIKTLRDFNDLPRVTRARK